VCNRRMERKEEHKLVKHRERLTPGMFTQTYIALNDSLWISRIRHRRLSHSTPIEFLTKRRVTQFSTKHIAFPHTFVCSESRVPNGLPLNVGRVTVFFDGARESVIRLRLKPLSLAYKANFLQRSVERYTLSFTSIDVQ
jgi:hypothetical protein